MVSKGITVEPYNNTVEGTVIYFHCNHHYALNEPQRRIAVCQRYGQWSPEISGELDHVVIALTMQWHAYH